MRRIVSFVAAVALLACCACAIAPGAAAQLGGGVSANNRFEMWVEDSLRAASYLNQFDLLYSSGAWNVSARLELDEEEWWTPERGTEIVRRYAEYHDETFGLRAGTYYATFGRGLVLRAMEDSEVRVDRDLDGLQGSVSYKRLSAQAAVGRIRNDRSRSRTDMLAGADAEIEIASGLRLGSAYLRRDAQSAPPGEEIGELGRPAIEECAGGRISFVRGLFDAYLEGAKRFRRGENDPRGGWTWTSAKDGHAWYGSVSAGVPGYTVIVEGKDYLRYDLPYATPPPANQAGQPINNGIDERGGGATLTASPTTDLTIEASGSYAEARDEPGERSDALGTIRKDWWGKGALKVGGEWIREQEMGSHTLREHAGPTLEASYYVSEQASLAFHGSFFSWTNHYRGQESQDYTEVTADVTFSLGQSRAATLSIIKASENVAEFAFDDQWINLEITWAFGYRHDLKVKIGQERGGIVCSGGICHYESPFEGVRMELTSRL